MNNGPASTSDGKQGKVQLSEILLRLDGLHANIEACKNCIQSTVYHAMCSETI